MFNIKIYTIFIWLILLLLAESALAKPINMPEAENGVLDLRHWDFSSDGNIKLNGEWEFHWDAFIGTDKTHDSTKQGYMYVPGLWNNFTKKIGLESSDGYASYKITLLLANKDELAIKLINFATACEIFIDGKSLFKSGQPGKNKENTEPSFKPGIINFTPQNTQVDIILQIANYHHKKGGIWEPLLLGKAQQIKEYHNKKIFTDVFFIGSLFIIGLFHLIMFSQHKKDYATLYFALFSILISIRFVLNGEFSIYLLNDFSWSLLIHADYLSFYLGIFFFSLFLTKLYPAESDKIPIRLILFISALFSISVFIIPTKLITYNILYFQIFIILAGSYAFIVIYRAIRNKRTGSLNFLFGFIVLFITLVHDVLKQNNIIESINLASFGLIVFIMFQASILSTRVRRALANNEKLSKRLKKRNHQLKMAKKKAEESDKFKSTFLANMSHEIRTPMNGIIGFSELLSYNEYSTEERTEFISIINERSKQLLGIVNDIIDITKIETGQIEISSVDTDINSMLEELLLYYTHTLNNNIKIIKNTSFKQDYLKVVTDDIKLRQILDNLISNAIKFTKKGSVEFGYKIQSNKLHFFVIDTGIGLTREEQAKIFDRFSQANNNISRKYGGTGLGLAIAKAYTEKLGGELWIESEKNKGSTFGFSIPYLPIKSLS